MRALADYNLGLVLLRENREGAARRSFEHARRESNDEKITRLADAALQRLDSANEVAAVSPRWVTFVDADVGYDDNVALLDESTLPASTSASSAFRELLAVITGPISNGLGFRFNGSVYSIGYDDAGEFDETAARIGGSYGWTPGAWHIEAESRFDYAVLDGSAFDQQLGAGVNLTRPLSSTTMLGISVMHDEVEGNQTQYSLLNGSREQFGLSWDRNGTNNGRLTFAYLYESNDRRSPSVSPSRNGLTVRYRYGMNRVWTADLSLSLRRSVFAETAGTRNEDRTDLSVGVRRHFSHSWHLAGAYLRSDNRSNVAAFEYTRNRLSLGLSKDF
ncbi:MAG TPA: surface lipoprotein assembly modifier [Gammaproteobacteria bacterium]|nr:surface lipoprotein assembly modifier [Gammaproteobacteria bacterium]